MESNVLCLWSTDSGNSVNRVRGNLFFQSVLSFGIVHSICQRSQAADPRPSCGSDKAKEQSAQRVSWDGFS